MALGAMLLAELMPDELSSRLRKSMTSIKLETVCARKFVSPNLNMSITKYDFWLRNRKHWPFETFWIEFCLELPENMLFEALEFVVQKRLNLRRACYDWILHLNL
jgi:hypothetical protein